MLKAATGFPSTIARQKKQTTIIIANSRTYHLGYHTHDDDETIRDTNNFMKY